MTTQSEIHHRLPYEREYVAAHSASWQRTLDRVRARGAAINYSLPDPVTLRSFSLGEAPTFSLCPRVLCASCQSMVWGQHGSSGPEDDAPIRFDRSTNFVLMALQPVRKRLGSFTRGGARVSTNHPSGRRPRKNHHSVLSGSGPAPQGFRVLAIDLDPRDALSEMLGYFSSLIPVYNASMYSAKRDRGEITASARSGGCSPSFFEQQKPCSEEKACTGTTKIN